jgi:hypothetical protein
MRSSNVDHTKQPALELISDHEGGSYLDSDDSVIIAASN